MEKLVAISSLLPNVRKISQDMPSGSDWIKKFPEQLDADLPETFFSNSTQLRLLTIEQDQQICVNCPGISACPKTGDAKGHVLSFRVQDGALVEQVKKCQPLLDQEQMTREQKLQVFSGMNDGHLRLNFDTFPNEQKRLNKDLCMSAWDFANKYEAGQPEKGFYIYGDYGTAKTHLACAILNKLVSRGLRVLYVQAERTFAALSDLYFREDREGLPTRTELLAKFISADVLVIDELGHENVSDSSIWTLYTILNGREPQQKPVIVTSNFKISELAELYVTKSKGETQKRAGALISRLLFLTQSYEMKGEDFRSRDYLKMLKEELED